MANEISVQFSGTVSNGNLFDKFGPETGQFNLNQATAGGPAPGFVTIGTSEEDISFGDLATPTLVVITNLDTTNFVKYGPKNASNALQDFGKILAGKTNFITLDSGVTLRMQADTANVNVVIKGYEL